MINILLNENSYDDFFFNIVTLAMFFEMLKAIFLIFNLKYDKHKINDGLKTFGTVFLILFILSASKGIIEMTPSLIFIVILVIITIGTYSIINTIKSQDVSNWNNILLIFVMFIFFWLTSSTQNNFYYQIANQLSLSSYYMDIILSGYITLKIGGMLLFFILGCLIIAVDAIDILDLLYENISTMLTDLYKLFKNIKFFVISKKYLSFVILPMLNMIKFIISTVKNFKKNIIKTCIGLLKLSVFIAFIFSYMIIQSKEYTFSDNVDKVYEITIFSIAIPLIISIFAKKKD